jgi:hypothetical protein
MRTALGGVLRRKTWPNRAPALPLRPVSLTMGRRLPASAIHFLDLNLKALFLTAFSIPLGICALIGTPNCVEAHGFAGDRFFPATISTDDPFVADELSLPTFQAMRQPGAPPTNTFDLSADVALKLTPSFGIEAREGYMLQKSHGSRLRTGFDNFEIGGKYQFLVNAEHETIVSVGVNAGIGGTGRASIGADRFSTITPGLFFGKGFGDIPDCFWALRPFAVTGQVGVSFPTSSSVGLGDAVQRIPNNLEWGIALEYSLIYLEEHVKDIGLRAPFNRLIPLVEFAMQTPLNRINGPTTGTVSPGIIWSGQYFQLGVEAIVPINAHTGNNVGVVGQVHFYLDDILPKIFGKPFINP